MSNVPAAKASIAVATFLMIGQHAVGWCIDKLADDEILARMTKGEAAYKLDGGFY